VEALAQGVWKKNPEGDENPGEHRAPRGLNSRAVATDSRAEQSPEGGPAGGRSRVKARLEAAH
jgi:hypothetical protein